jgi:hypothetical protein
MATVTGFTAARMQEIEDSTIVDGDIVGDNLILKRRDLVEIDAGNVRGPVGPTGPVGEVSQSELDAAIAAVMAAIAAAHADGAITTAMLQNLSVTGAKLADNAVTTAKIADNAITQDKMGDSSVENTSIGTNAVSNEKIGALAVDDRTIANATISEGKFSDTLAQEQVGTTVNGWGSSVYYWKIGNMVFFQYRMGPNTPTTNTIFTFPEGYRPRRQAGFVGWTEDGPTQIEITTGGVMTGPTIAIFLTVSGVFLI